MGASFFVSLKACCIHGYLEALHSESVLWASWHFCENWSLNPQPLHCGLQVFASVPKETITRSLICVNILSLPPLSQYSLTQTLEGC